MNLNDPVLLNVATNVASSIQVILNPNSATQDRQNATIFCENFRSNSNPAELYTVGFMFVSKFQSNYLEQQTTNVGGGGGSSHDEILAGSQLALVGFQFIEDVIKYKWSQFNEREMVKENMLNLISQGIGLGNNQIETIPSYLHEMIARVVVEIAKREWPQLWPNLFPILFQLILTSNLPLLILRRLAEDVFILQKVDSSSRRKDLSAHLNAISEDVVTALYNTLKLSLEHFKQSKSEILKKKIKITLASILPYVEWAKISSFLTEDRIPILFELLEDTDFRMEAADCIIQLIERKVNRKEDRFEIPIASSLSKPMTHLLSAIHSCKSEDEEFLNKLGDILKAMAYASAPEIGKEGLENVMKALVMMSSRNEALAIVAATAAANSFLRKMSTETLDKAELLKGGLVELLNHVLKKCITTPSSSVERYEMTRVKGEFAVLLRKIGNLLPGLYNLISSWFRHYLSHTNVNVEIFQWEALVLVLSSVPSFARENAEIVNIGLQDLELCLTRFTTESNLKLKSVILSGVSALFVFLSLSKSRNEFSENHTKLLHSILEAIFNCFLYEAESGKEIRHHAASLLVKLSADFPEVLVPTFDNIYSLTIKMLPTLAPFEHQCLIESLLLISNSWNDSTKQSTLMELLVNKTEWKEISNAIKNPQHFLLIFREETAFYNERNIFLRNLSIAHAILRRIKFKKGDSTSTNSTHPAFHYLFPIIPTVLEFIQLLHSFMVERPEFKFIMELDEAEMSQILGVTKWSTEAQLKITNFHKENLKKKQEGSKINEVQLSESFQARIKSFFRVALEHAYIILGLSSSLFTPEIYSVPQLGEMFLYYVGGHCNLLDDYRLFNVIKFVLKYFLLSCPILQADQILKPFLQNFLPFMLSRLETRWTDINNSKKEDEDDQEMKEVLENSTFRLLTKEYFDLLQRLLGHKGKPNKSRKSSDDTEVATGDMDVDAEQGGDNANDSKETMQDSDSNQPQADLKLVLIGDQICATAIIRTCLMALRWDGTLALRSCRCLLICWDVISKESDILQSVFVECLRSMSTLVDPESIDILQKLVDLICATSLGKDPVVARILFEWGIPTADIEKLTHLCQTAKNEKHRKDFLKKLIRHNPNVQSNKKSIESNWLDNLPKLITSNPTKMVQNLPVNLSDCFSVIHS